jgi:transcriptional regulator with XRE-family HTH domain
MSEGNALTEKPPLAARLKSALALREMSVAEFARQLEVHSSAVWNTLSGERNYPHILEAVAREVGEPAEDVAAEIQQKRETAA